MSLPDLQAYVVAHQDRRLVKIYRRDHAGAWQTEPEVCIGGESFFLPRLTRPCSVDELYDTILDEAGRSLLR